jgi:acyl dehydratase
MTERTRALTLTAELLRWYSRRGNFHADLDAARELGLAELVAQGMQVAGPAYGLLLDEWGHEWLATGTIELKFVGRVVADERVEAHVDVEGDAATITVVGLRDGSTRVVGHATRRGGASRG